MKKQDALRFFLIAISALSIVNCGGGGGGSGHSGRVPNYAGAWSTNVSLVSNSCPRAIPDQFQVLYVLHNVNQSLSEDSLGNQILDVVLDDGADTYVGVGEIGEKGDGNTFSVTGSPHELPGFLNGYTCIETINFDYDSITKDTVTTNGLYAGFVSRHSSITCTRGSDIKTCDVTYTGTSYASR